MINQIVKRFLKKRIPIILINSELYALSIHRIYFTWISILYRDGPKFGHFAYICWKYPELIVPTFQWYMQTDDIDQFRKFERDTLISNKGYNIAWIQKEVKRCFFPPCFELRNINLNDNFSEIFPDKAEYMFDNCSRFVFFIKLVAVFAAFEGLRVDENFIMSKLTI